PGSPTPTAASSSAPTQSSPPAPTPSATPAPSEASTPAAPSASPGPAASATPSPPRTSAPAPSPSKPATGPTTFGDGAYLVGTDLKPGTYRTRKPSKGCSWARTNGPQSTDVAVSEVTDDVTIVTIARTDVGFRTEDCGTWTSNLSRITSSR